MSYSLPSTLPSDPHSTADTPTHGILDRFLQEYASFETTELTSAISAVLYKTHAVGHRYLPNIEVGLLNIEFFFQTLDSLKVLQHVNPTGKCLEWTDVMYVTTPRFDAVCHKKLEFAHIDAGYCGSKGTYWNFTGKFGNGFCGTVYNATRIIPKNFIDLLIRTQVFEHLMSVHDRKCITPTEIEIWQTVLTESGSHPFLHAFAGVKQDILQRAWAFPAL